MKETIGPEVNPLLKEALKNRAARKEENEVGKQSLFMTYQELIDNYHDGEGAFEKHMVSFEIPVSQENPIKGVVNQYGSWSDSDGSYINVEIENLDYYLHLPSRTDRQGKINSHKRCPTSGTSLSTRNINLEDFHNYMSLADIIKKQKSSQKSQRIPVKKS